MEILGSSTKLLDLPMKRHEYLKDTGQKEDLSRVTIWLSCMLTSKAWGEWHAQGLVERGDQECRAHAG